MIRKMKELNPDCLIDLITGNDFGTEKVLIGTQRVNKIHFLRYDASLSNKLDYFFRIIRNEAYDAVFLPIDATPNFLLIGLLFAHIKKKYVHYRSNNSWKARLRIIAYYFFLPGAVPVPILPGRHEEDLSYDLLEIFHGRPFQRDYNTFLHYNENPGVLDKFDLKPKQYIVFQPSAANGALTPKTWHPANFAELSVEINERYSRYKIVIVGDKGDLSALENTALLKDKNITNTIGHTTIDELCAIIKNSAVVVAHDSSVAHIANALNCKLIALFGPTNYTCTRPLGENSRILYSRNECFAAMYDQSVSESDLAKRYPPYYCMNEIKVSDIMKEIDNLLVDVR